MGCGCGLCTRRTGRVIVESLPGLAAKPSRLDLFLLKNRRCKTRIAEISGGHRPGHCKIHIMADQVHQLERPHAESTAIAHNRIERCRIATSFLKNAQRFSVKGTGHSIDNEARSGSDHYRCLPRSEERRVGKEC